MKPAAPVTSTVLPSRLTLFYTMGQSRLKMSRVYTFSCTSARQSS